MATIHITLTDTPSGGVSVQHDFTPAIGKTCTNAQAAALDIFTRTRREWGMKEDAAIPPSSIAKSLCQCREEMTPTELNTGRCVACGKAVF
jgi:hypothetical protein